MGGGERLRVRPQTKELVSLRGTTAQSSHSGLRSTREHKMGELVLKLEMLGQMRVELGSLSLSLQEAKPTGRKTSPQVSMSIFYLVEKMLRRR